MRTLELNIPLLLGGLLVSLLLILAVWGSALAPHDPLVSQTIELDGQSYGGRPLRPLHPFRTAEFPLGFDVIGRDQYSRILWGVRPTLVLCAAVVAARLVIGVSLGLIAGWFGGRVARLVDVLTGVCLAIPLLAVAIVVILVVGIERGLVAFVAALALTGWADLAGLVKARTQIIREAPYIEAAQAIGRWPAGILWHHVLPQLFAILPMLIAFEMSAVLLVVAELGYLGFFIGGGFIDVQIQLDELHLLTADYPELGQMLSQFFGLLTRAPGVAFSAGLLIFAALVGFTLLGEGLRRRLDVTRVRRRPWLRRSRDARQHAGALPGVEA